MPIHSRTERPAPRRIARPGLLPGLIAVCLTVAASSALTGCGGGDNKFPNQNNNNNNQPYSGTLTRTEPQMREVIRRFLEFNVPPLNTLTPQQARQQPSVADAVRAELQRQGRSTTPEAVASVVNITVPGPAGPLPVRVYTPSGTGPFPVLVYFHGGGFVIATIDTYDSSCRALANAAKCVVISVEYRKAPENKFPAAPEDAYAATQYVIANAGQFGGDPNRVAVGGESAGGNLAADVCILAKERNGRRPIYQLLVYPVANTNPDDASFIENANAVPLNRDNVIYFLNNYISSPADKDNRLIALARTADLTNLPPATIVAAEIDPLRTEGEQLRDRLENAGVTVRYRRFDGVTHEFFGTGAVVDRAKEAVQYAADGLRGAFGN